MSLARENQIKACLLAANAEAISALGVEEKIQETLVRCFSTAVDMGLESARESAARDLVLSGAALSADRWDSLSWSERQAVLRVRNQAQALQAAAVGIASQGKLEAAQVAAPADGGASKRALLLQQALDAAQRDAGGAQ